MRLIIMLWTQEDVKENCLCLGGALCSLYLWYHEEEKNPDAWKYPTGFVLK